MSLNNLSSLKALYFTKEANLVWEIKLLATWEHLSNSLTELYH